MTQPTAETLAAAEQLAAELRAIAAELAELRHRTANTALAIGHKFPGLASRASCMTDGISWSSKWIHEVAGELAPPRAEEPPPPEAA